MSPLQNFFRFVDEIDWMAIRAPDHKVENVSTRIVSLMLADTEEIAKYWFDKLDNEIVVQGVATNYCLPCIKVIFYGLRFLKVSKAALSWIYELIWQIIIYYNEIEISNADESDRITLECGEYAKGHLYVLLSRDVSDDFNSLDLLNRIRNTLAE